ncbi:class I SAM-dependent methyltransferase [Actinomadura alba]|uniref:Class I SAM-dependent methyltransferase n=1 Tax=Actinomadura alba TaxID=406431 RepID=A0ABR7LRE1_9ACTN|nr:class I SAM-dependent methyltransferase [Actinomadura alba]MBC6467402.1 class I SAM-dependent methyltransferase [Actinomadura alba]
MRDVLVSELLARAADVHSGERVLDVAAGTGNTALAAARRGGQVTATDLVPGMLETTSDRAAAEGLELNVQVADAQDLPFEDNSFDVVLSSFGAMYAPDQQRAADELLRVCRPGGRIGLANWTPDGLVARLQKVMAANMPAPPGARGTPPVMWGMEEHCRKLFGSRVATLSSVVRTNEWCAPSAEAQAAFLVSHLAPWRAGYQSLAPDVQEKVTAGAIAEIDRANRASDGTLVAKADYLELVAIVA